MNQRALFRRIYRENKAKVWGYLLRKTPEQDAEDLSQKSWLAFAVALKKTKEIEKPEALLWRIVKNKTVDFYKHNKRLPPMAVVDEQLIAETYNQGGPRLNLFRWPPGVSDLERQIIIRKFVLGQTYAEMAAELGKSVKALEHTYTRLIQKLKARYHKGRKS